jgi:hypothetical protein
VVRIVVKILPQITCKVLAVVFNRLTEVVYWNYKIMGSQRSYLKGLIDNRDDADDEY